MSYILDALRRLEQDKERTRRGTNPVEAVMVPDLEEAETRYRRGFWWVGIGVVLLVMVIGATYWITRQALVPTTDQVRQEPALRLSSLQPEGRAGPLPIRQEPSTPTADGTTVDGHSVRSLVPSALPTPADPPIPSPRLRPAEVRPPTVPETEAPSIPVEEEAWPPASLGEDTSVSAREGEAASRKTSGADVIQEWRGTEIKINAIAYSRERNGRFAVVNLKTVHEGDQVEGLAVVEIEENGIVFEQAGTKYRVTLGRR